MAEGLLRLLLLCGLYTPLGTLSQRVVIGPSTSELTEALINSERLHTDHVSGAVAVPYGSDGFTIIMDDNSTESISTVYGTVNLNKIVDGLLDSLREDIVKQGKDRISIPDIDETFKKKVGFIKVKGEFKGEDGWVESLSTVHRTADAVASSYGKWIRVSCGFGLGHLEVGYSRYKAKFMELGPQGKINAIIGKNSLLLNATVSWGNRKCNMTLNQLVLNQFGGLNLRVTGLGPMNWLLSRISTWILQHFKTEVKSKIESTLRDEIEKKLAHFDCSKYIPQL
jgi:hypothetical protein